MKTQAVALEVSQTKVGDILLRWLDDAAREVTFSYVTVPRHSKQLVPLAPLGLIGATGTVVALYVSTAKHGVNGITLHRTTTEAYAALVEYLTIGHEDEADYADDAIPTELDELMEWCESRGDEQGTEWYCTEVAIPPVAAS